MDTAAGGHRREPLRVTLSHELLADVESFRAAPPDLTGLITDEEQDALVARAAVLLELGAMPLPTPSRPIPWPPF